MLFQALVGIQAYKLIEGETKSSAQWTNTISLEVYPSTFIFLIMEWERKPYFEVLTNICHLLLMPEKCNYPVLHLYARSHTKNWKKNFVVSCCYLIHSSANSTGFSSTSYKKIKKKNITDIIFYNHHCHHQFVRITRIKKICKSEVYTILAMNKNAVKNKGFQKWNSEILEEVKVFPIGKERFAVWKHK